MCPICHSASCLPSPHVSVLPFFFVAPPTLSPTVSVSLSPCLLWCLLLRQAPKQKFPATTPTCYARPPPRDARPPPRDARPPPRRPPATTQRAPAARRARMARPPWRSARPPGPRWQHSTPTPLRATWHTTRKSRCVRMYVTEKPKRRHQSPEPCAHRAPANARRAPATARRAPATTTPATRHTNATGTQQQNLALKDKPQPRHPSPGP